MSKTIVGVKKTTKDGKTSYTLCYTEPFADWESADGNTALGLKCGSEWTRVDCEFVKPGDVVDFVYDKGFQDKAILVDVVLKKTSK
jgi:hypothetical protein